MTPRGEMTPHRKPAAKGHVTPGGLSPAWYADTF